MWTERWWRGSQASHTGRTLDVPLLPPAQRAVASAVTGPRALVGLGTKPSPSLANQPLRGKGGGWETRHCFASVLNPDLVLEAWLSQTWTVCLQPRARASPGDQDFEGLWPCLGSYSAQGFELFSGLNETINPLTFTFLDKPAAL